MADTKESLERKKEIKEKFEQFYKTRDKDLRNELIEDHMYSRHPFQQIRRKRNRKR